MTLAVTGATGFVGASLLEAAAGRPVRALARRPQAARGGVEWVAGDLGDRAALDRLVEGADAVIHVAGVTNARRQVDFDLGNVVGTAALVEAARRGGVGRFIHVSSLAARRPDLSMYGGSKAAAEGAVRASSLDWTIVRPPAVYGPGDRDMLALFQAARRGFAPVPAGRFSAIHVADLAAALLAVTGAGPSGATYEVDDGAAGGHGHDDFARAVAAALGVRVRLLRLPPGALRLAAALDSLGGRLTGRLPRLSLDRARYIEHRDWTVDPAKTPPAAVWRPYIGLAEGVRATADWYRAKGWLG